MTNDEGMTKAEYRKHPRWLSDFFSIHLLHCFVIGHSCFVICKLLLVLLFAVLIVSCVGRRITKANVDEVAEGMSKKQVESILGPPTELDNKDFVIMKKTTYLYRQDKDTVTIVFKDDKVVEKQSTLTD